LPKADEYKVGAGSPPAPPPLTREAS
jgi:hypothetical protein